MAICTFFGHHDCPKKVKEALRNEIKNLIVNHGVELFYVGNQGQFNMLVHQTLREMKKSSIDLNYRVVLAETFFSKRVTFPSLRAAVFRRDQWMVEQADYVITYVARLFGNAACFEALAKKKGKTVINIAIRR